MKKYIQVIKKIKASKNIYMLTKAFQIFVKKIYKLTKKFTKIDW